MGAWSIITLARSVTPGSCEDYFHAYNWGAKLLLAEFFYGPVIMQGRYRFSRRW